MTDERKWARMESWTFRKEKIVTVPFVAARLHLIVEKIVAIKKINLFYLFSDQRLLKWNYFRGDANVVCSQPTLVPIFRVMVE